MPATVYNNFVRIKRRDFLLLAAGSLLRADDRPKRDMLVRSVRPEDLEMPLSGFVDYLTPTEHFFVRTHVYVPAVNVNDWRLNVGGSVATSLVLTMDDLKKCPPPSSSAYSSAPGTAGLSISLPCRACNGATEPWATRAGAAFVWPTCSNTPA